MDKTARADKREAALDELVYEPVAEPALDPAVGLVLESLRRRQPAMTIRWS